MVKGVRDIADEIAKKANTVKKRALWDEGGAGRAALHAIAGALLGGVNGVDGAIKAAIGAGVSTAIAPFISTTLSKMPLPNRVSKVKRPSV